MGSRIFGLKAQTLAKLVLSKDMQNLKTMKELGMKNNFVKSTVKAIVKIPSLRHIHPFIDW